jgi:hypothetical protein
MKHRRATVLGAWILWRVTMVPDPSMKQLVVQVWLPEQSFAKYEYCQRGEYAMRDAVKQPSEGVIKFVCMPDTFTPPQQELAH